CGSRTMAPATLSARKPVVWTASCSQWMEQCLHLAPDQPYSTSLQNAGNKRAESARNPVSCHVRHRPHVAFQIGGEIRVVEGRYVDVWVGMQFRKTTPPHDGRFEHGLRQSRTNLLQG